ncbi:MAG: hypothetical protein ACTIA6_09165 [Pseudoclavibacter sp.]
MTALVVLAACSSNASPEPVGEKLDMRLYGAPEDAPPSAEFDGLPLQIASASWRVGGEMEHFGAPDQSETKINDVREQRSVLDLEIHSTVVPMLVSVRNFVDVDDQGLPTSDVPTREITCEADPASLCAISMTSTSTLLVFQGGVLVKGMNVIEAYYATQGDADVEEGINHYAISWALRIR